MIAVTGIGFRLKLNNDTTVSQHSCLSSSISLVFDTLISVSLEHLFISCLITERFCLEFIQWCNNIHIELEKLSEMDKRFAIWDRKEDFLLLNHLLILARQNIYDCRSKLTHPSLRLFISKVYYIYQIEFKINKFTKHD